MTYQESMFSLPVMQDRSGRQNTDYPRPPKCVGDCAAGREARSLPPDDPRAERCQAFGCTFNLIGEIGRLKNESRAVAAIVRRYDDDVWDTCLLDAIANNGETGIGEELEYDETGDLLGISREAVSQRVAEAAFKFRCRVAEESSGDDVRSDMRRMMARGRDFDLAPAVVRAVVDGGLTHDETAEEFGIHSDTVTSMVKRAGKQTRS